MSNATLARPSTFGYSTDSFGIQPIKYVKDNGTLVLERVAVFRSGTFRDSSGMQNTWEGIHLNQMISNWDHLRNNNIFADVPVRDGHAGWIMHGLPGNGQTVGWHTKLATEKIKAPHDGVEYDYLLADYEITDPRAREMIQNGTWRNRSAEIIPYVTNNEAEFWPVYGGFAYVDIPAVEGLKFSASDTNGGLPPRLFVFLTDKETSVADSPTPAQTTPLITPAPQAFSVNGATVTDPGAVQNHITALENFQRETLESNRAEFVNSLATAGKIVATQVDGLAAFAKSLTAEQYKTWTETFGAAPTQQLLGQHGVTVTNPTGTPAGTVSAADDQVAVWQNTVAMHVKAGTPKAQIEKTPSYQKLVAAGKTPTL